MILSKEAIDEFKEIYEREFGEKISDAEAEEMGLRVIRIVKWIHGIR